MGKIVIYLLILLLPLLMVAQVPPKAEGLTVVQKELDYLKQRNSDLRVQLQKVKKELAVFKEVQIENMDNVNNSLLELSSNSKLNKELIEVIKQELEKNNETLESRVNGHTRSLRILLAILLIFSIAVACVMSVLYFRLKKQVRVFSEKTETRLVHVKEDLQLEIQKISKGLNERIDIIEKNFKDKK